MNVIVCLDERQGMMFNKRRQSQDRAVRERILHLCEGSVLWMKAYSYKLYEPLQVNQIETDTESSQEGVQKSLQEECLKDAQIQTERKPVKIEVEEAFLQKAEDGDFCLVEDASLKPYESQIEKVIVFCWNKKYPADFYLDLNLDSGEWELESETKFAGISHPEITEKVYRHVICPDDAAGASERGDYERRHK
ncbi:MAG: hypothetical protein Q4E24_02545 [bacterium]|nr:hypothetical protein [bacterium]